MEQSVDEGFHADKVEFISGLDEEQRKLRPLGAVLTLISQPQLVEGEALWENQTLQCLACILPRAVMS